MRVAILATPAQKLACKNLILEDYGRVDIVVGHDLNTKPPTGVVTGDHVILEGEPEDIITALRPFDDIWVGRGQPMEQRFELMELKA